MPAAAPIIAGAALSSGLGAAFGVAFTGFTVMQTALISFTLQVAMGTDRVALAAKGPR